MILKAFIAFIGLSEGIIVGTAAIAFLTILDIIPRLAQITDTNKYMKIYEVIIVLNVTMLSLANSLDVTIHVCKMAVAMVGLLMGIFIGLLTAGLTEITNVIPIILSRFRLYENIRSILISLISGKVIGSLLYWIVFNK